VASRFRELLLVSNSLNTSFLLQRERFWCLLVHIAKQHINLDTSRVVTAIISRAQASGKSGSILSDWIEKENSEGCINIFLLAIKSQNQRQLEKDGLSLFQIIYRSKWLGIMANHTS